MWKKYSRHWDCTVCVGVETSFYIYLQEPFIHHLIPPLAGAVHLGLSLTIPHNPSIAIPHHPSPSLTIPHFLVFFTLSKYFYTTVKVCFLCLLDQETRSSMIYSLLNTTQYNHNWCWVWYEYDCSPPPHPPTQELYLSYKQHTGQCKLTQSLTILLDYLRQLSLTILDYPRQLSSTILNSYPRLS